MSRFVINALVNASSKDFETIVEKYLVDCICSTDFDKTAVAIAFKFDVVRANAFHREVGSKCSKYVQPIVNTIVKRRSRAHMCKYDEVFLKALDIDWCMSTQMFSIDSYVEEVLGDTYAIAKLEHHINLSKGNLEAMERGRKVEEGILKKYEDRLAEYFV